MVSPQIFRSLAPARVVAACVLTLVFAIAFSGQARAQGVGFGPSSQFAPTPTLSPYLDLLRTNTGPLPNYQQFVRPRIQLRRTLVQQANQINRFRTAPSTSRIDAADPRRLTTGVRTRFLHYSTFYPALEQRR